MRKGVSDGILAATAGVRAEVREGVRVGVRGRETEEARERDGVPGAGELKRDVVEVRRRGSGGAWGTRVHPNNAARTDVSEGSPESDNDEALDSVSVTVEKLPVVNDVTDVRSEFN